MKIVRLGLKSFENILEEVKQCPFSFVSAAGQVNRADRWTDIASDVVSTSLVSGIVSLFQLRYLAQKFPRANRRYHTGSTFCSS